MTCNDVAGAWEQQKWLEFGLEFVNAMTNEAKTGYDSAIEQSIVFELTFGGIGAIRWLSMIWKLLSCRIH